MTPRGTAVATAGHGYPLDEPSPGYAVQAPEAVLDAVRAASATSSPRWEPRVWRACRSARPCTGWSASTATVSC
jgi:hypothetical protein